MKAWMFPFVRLCILLVLLLLGSGQAFIVSVVPSGQERALPQTKTTTTTTTTTALLAESEGTPSTTTSVEVCGFKDCKRIGGGPRLQKFINQILEERELTEQFTVVGCDCQGECGYGPNVVVDGKLVNDVRGREAVLQALGLEPDAPAGTTHQDNDNNINIKAE